MNEYEKKNVAECAEILSALLPEIKIIQNYLSSVISQQNTEETNKDRLLQLWLSTISDRGLSNAAETLHEIQKKITLISTDLAEISDDANE